MTATEPDIPVPKGDASWPEVIRFALSYNAYVRDGDFERVSRVANECLERWKANGSLPEALNTARLALFFEQRRYRHLDSEPSGENWTYVKSLLELIDLLSGGKVPGPSDPWP